MFQTIALAIGVSPADVELMDTRLSGPDVSLNAPVTDSDSTGQTERVEFLVDDKPLQDETVGEAIDGDRRVLWLREALGVLTERELRIVRERRLEEESATLEALGSRLGISKERVRQIENRAMEKLRRALSDRTEADAATRARGDGGLTSGFRRARGPWWGSGRSLDRMSSRVPPDRR